MRHAALLLALLSSAAPCAGGTVTMESLLREMTDFEAPTYLPEPSYTTRLWSSYDRRTRPGTEGTADWYANEDSSQFIREETNGGRRELVMVDAKGPGAVVRFWVTVADHDGSGVMRVYVDGREAIAGNPLKIVSGGALCPPPLSDSVSHKTDYRYRGHDLYLPIPYSKSLKVTYECANVNPPEGSGVEAPEKLFYNIETRTYAPGTDVEPYSGEVLRRAAGEIGRANRELLEDAVDFPGAEYAFFDGELAPGASVVREVEREGGGAVRLFALSPDDGKPKWCSDVDQALRSVVVQFEFDGERTVWAPVGDFFCVGYRRSEFRTRYTRALGGLKLESRWAMPFRRTCRMTLRNLWDRPLLLRDTRLAVAPYRWDDARSMHFGAGWRELYEVSTRRDGGHYDVNYVTLRGQGLFMGTATALFHTSAIWWGEGDEKAWVDGEDFPSFVGTGTEDYYGYAWGNANSFSHPFLAQPVSSSPGFTENVRLRSLDAIPFTKSLRFCVEMWHWRETEIYYAPASFWYMRPGGTSNRVPDEEAARRPVPIHSTRARNPAPPAAAER